MGGEEVGIIQMTVEIERCLFCTEDMKVQYVSRRDYIGKAFSTKALFSNVTTSHMWLFTLELIKLKMHSLNMINKKKMQFLNNTSSISSAQ